MTFKNHGCCGHIFPALDGIRALKAQVAFTAEDIGSITVHGYGPTAAICDRMVVETARDARFSVQYCIGALLAIGRVRMEAFTPEALAREDVRSIMPRVKVVEDPEIAAAYPRRRMARLRVELKDGRALDHFQQTRKGDPDDPLTDDELIEKFDELAAVVLDDRQRENLRRQVLYGTDTPGALTFARRTT
jgi:2-methylcitrate dehydratase PrpD